MDPLEASRLVTDEYSAKILVATFKKPKSAIDLSREYGIPIAADGIPVSGLTKAPMSHRPTGPPVFSEMRPLTIFSYTAASDGPAHHGPRADEVPVPGDPGRRRGRRRAKGRRDDRGGACEAGAGEHERLEAVHGSRGRERDPPLERHPVGAEGPEAVSRPWRGRRELFSWRTRVPGLL